MRSTGRFAGADPGAARGRTAAADSGSKVRAAHHEVARWHAGDQPRRTGGPAGLRRSSKVRFELIPDDPRAAHLPAFVKTPQAVTDGHLVELARKNSLCLVTLDRGIPGSLFIG